MPQSKTTPNYDNKNAITPDYDLYPSLNRHLINGDILSIPPPPVYHQIEVVDSIGRTLTPTPVGTTNLNSDHLHEWDLYPSVLRKIENYGSDKMRQHLHAMETSTHQLK